MESSTRAARARFTGLINPGRTIRFPGDEVLGIQASVKLYRSPNIQSAIPVCLVSMLLGMPRMATQQPHGVQLRAQEAAADSYVIVVKRF
ncbi:hypothetical protein EVAR_50108_1 [Eumeta japonica]|uniref:Uncharacterized protein n=1 Tax=Eumeta variegata TaxID=151549 RepID=A0A4C1XWV2_EUMVA|nr:hypothetical protein EVAR_50108_1 [Eumeta japonica]